MEHFDLGRLLALAGIEGIAPSMPHTDKTAVGPQGSMLKMLNEHVTASKGRRINEVSPPGFKGTVKAMKKHKDIDNPYALAWYEKNKGDKSHYKKDGTKKKESVNEIMSDDWYPPFQQKKPHGEMPPPAELDAQRRAAQERVKAKRLQRGGVPPAFGEAAPSGKWHDDAAIQQRAAAEAKKAKQMAMQAQNATLGQEAAPLAEKAPKGWEGTTKAMKKHKEVDNPWALANWHKNKGHKSHRGPRGGKRNESVMETGGPAQLQSVNASGTARVLGNLQRGGEIVDPQGRRGIIDNVMPTGYETRFAVRWDDGEYGQYQRRDRFGESAMGEAGDGQVPGEYMIIYHGDNGGVDADPDFFPSPQAAERRARQGMRDYPWAVRYEIKPVTGMPDDMEEAPLQEYDGPLKPNLRRKYDE